MKNTAPNDSRFLDLLQRRLRGDFRRSDEQELNELASGDEFRTEALEGYQRSPEEDHQARLKALHGRLQARIPDTRRVAMWPRLLSIAAVLTLLFVAVWFVPGWLHDTTKDIAKQTPVLTPDTGIAASTQPAVPEEPALAPPREAAPTPQRKKAPVQTTPENDIASAGEKPVADDTNEALAEIQSAPLANDPQGVSPPVEAARQEEVAFQKSASPPVAAKPQATISLPPGRPAAGQTTLGGQPAVGWAAFNDYLRRNARLTPEARNNNISGPVRLDFTIDDAGKPTDFIILQALGFGCDERAIELVRGRQWLPGAGGRTQVEVWFRR